MLFVQTTVISSLKSSCIQLLGMSSRYPRDKGESSSQYKLCVPPASVTSLADDTHSLCASCSGAEHAQSALEIKCRLSALRSSSNARASLPEGSL